MLILLPPSETKRSGGGGRSLDLTRLALPQLGSQRRAVIESLVALSAEPAHAARVLKLGARQTADIDANAQLWSAPTLPAVDRYTGVLFDALDAGSLDTAARRWLGGHVLIHSAPLGPVGALDRIPAYRLATGASLPGLASLRSIWADAVGRALESAAPRFVLDLRSEAYVALGPVPSGVTCVYVRVVAQGPDGTVRALNHFNKHAKGALVRRLALARPRIRSVAAFAAWAREEGVDLRPTDDARVWQLTASAPGEADAPNLGSS